MLRDTGRTKDAILMIQDTFTGAEGGIRYVLFCDYMKEIGKQAEAGDEAAKEIENVVLRFGKLIEIVTGS